jgi:hypothetical protein
MSKVTFIYATHAGYNTLSDLGWRPDSQGARGSAIDVFELSGGRSWSYQHRLLGGWPLTSPC